MGLSNNITKMLMEKAKHSRIPLTVNFELLPICNLDCKMCYIRSEWSEVKKRGGLLSANAWLELAKQMKAVGTFYLLLTGGEIFLYPEFEKLYIALYRMGFSISLNTNATLIDEKAVEWLKKYPPRCVSISLYGSTNEAYEKLCGKQGMFTKVDYAIRLLKKNGITVEAKTILTPFNYDDLPGCYQYTKEMEIPYEVASYSFPPVRKMGEAVMQTRFTPEEVADCMFYINRIMFDKTACEETAKEYIRKYEDSKDIPGCEHWGLTCSGTNSSCWITWQGYMTPCAMLNFPVVRPLEIGFNEAWEELKRKTDMIHISSTCAHCDKRQVCTVCPASAYAETGDIGGTSSYHCRMTSRTIQKMYQNIANNIIDINSFSLDEDNKE